MAVNKNVDINVEEGTSRNSVTSDVDTSTETNNQKDVAITDVLPENTGHNKNQNNRESGKMVTYGIEDNPPIHLGLLLGLQVRIMSSCFACFICFI